MLRRSHRLRRRPLHGRRQRRHLTHSGIGIHWYRADTSMTEPYYRRRRRRVADRAPGGSPPLHTEFGRLHVRPREIAVVPRGVRFRVELSGPTARGYVVRTTAPPSDCSERGPIGAERPGQRA
ncbi:homogentisate 1,2-dioxygenase [Streptomyces sp. L7]